MSAIMRDVASTSGKVSSGEIDSALAVSLGRTVEVISADAPTSNMKDLRVD
jgi:hypothetical protein